jgi:hypothetical protein
MKLNHLNLGQALSRDEQKKIKGGTPYCSAGQFVQCECKLGPLCGEADANMESTGAVCTEQCELLGYGTVISSGIICYNGGCPA